jgi:NAD(P)H-hydrate epimerase
MKIFTSAQRKIIDTYTIENEPVSPLDLMERAAGKCSVWLMRNFNREQRFLIFVGFGNNGGDGLAIARHLAYQEYKVEVYLIHMSRHFSPEAEENFLKLKMQKKAKITEVYNSKNFPQIDSDDIVVDALFGSGLTKPLIGFPAEVIEYLNHCKGIKIAIDIPSGLFGEENPESEQIIAFKADYTLTFQFPFLSSLFQEGYNYTGNWHVLPIGLHKKIIDELPSLYHLTESEDIIIKPRSRFSHKGSYGHALLIAGSYGMTGACVLATRACLRTGVGLITAHIPRSSYVIMQTAIPEAIVSLDKSEQHFSFLPDISRFNAIAVGPGLGSDDETKHAFKLLLDSSQSPLVIDADALNILSQNKEWLELLPKESILTPHPKEFERLAGACESDYERLQKQCKFSTKYGVYVVLKKAFTSISSPDGSCWFNPTGNPGMGTAGSGDVLTGIILSLLAQGYKPQQAAIIGVYIHGLAGDIVAGQLGQEALIASDIIENIGMAFNKIMKHESDEN